MSGESTSAMKPSGLFLCIFMPFFVQSCCFSCVSVGERSVVSECVSKHRLWVANGACSCCCVPHFQSTVTVCGVFFWCSQGQQQCLVVAFQKLHALRCGSSAWFLCCRLPAALLPSQGTASWCVKGTKCLNNTVCQKTISSAAVIAVLR